MTFCSKISFFLFLKVIRMLFFKEMLYIYATKPFKFAYCCAHSKHERMYVVVTDKCSFAVFKQMYIFGLLK